MYFAHTYWNRYVIGVCTESTSYYLSIHLCKMQTFQCTVSAPFGIDFVDERLQIMQLGKLRQKLVKERSYIYIYVCMYIYIYVYIFMKNNIFFQIRGIPRGMDRCTVRSNVLRDVNCTWCISWCFLIWLCVTFLSWANSTVGLLSRIKSLVILNLSSFDVHSET